LNVEININIFFFCNVANEKESFRRFEFFSENLIRISILTKLFRKLIERKNKFDNIEIFNKMIDKFFDTSD